MSKKHKQVSAFSLEGQFLGFEVEDGYKIKRLRLATTEDEYCIKLSKESRASVKGILTLGDSIWVLGEKTINLETDEVKYKARLIKPLTSEQLLQEGSPAMTTLSPSSVVLPSNLPQLINSSKLNSSKLNSSQSGKTTILMCQKSDCMKRGGKAVLQALQQTLEKRGLNNEVAIKMTGCMKHCKAGPNVVIMPSKTRYSQITAKEIPALIDQQVSPLPTSS